MDARLLVSRRSHAHARLCCHPRNRNVRIRQKLAAGMTKKRRVYQPRVVGGKVMMPADLKRIDKYMLDIEHTAFGRHGGESRARKVAALFSRGRRMRKFGKGRQFDLAACHGSNDLPSRGIHEQIYV